MCSRQTQAQSGWNYIWLHTFPGCTDIRIGNKVVEVENPLEDQQEDPPSSGEDTKIEVGKKVNPLLAYPPKLGQVVAAIHITIIQKCARMFIKEKPIKAVLGSSGMYLNKSIALKVEMPIVCASTSCPASNIDHILCCKATHHSHGLDELVGTTKCTMQRQLPSIIYGAVQMHCVLLCEF